MKRLAMIMLAVVSLMAARMAHAGEAAPPRTNFTGWDSTLRLVERSDSYEKGSFARWSGRLTLTGRVVLQFDRASDGGKQPDNVVDRHGVINFEPDASSLARLPAATNYHPLTPKAIWIGETGRSTLVPLIGLAAFDRLQGDRASRFEFPAVLTLTELSTSVECDHRSYMATVSAIRLLKAPMLASHEPADLGC